MSSTAPHLAAPAVRRRSRSAAVAALVGVAVTVGTAVPATAADQAPAEPTSKGSLFHVGQVVGAHDAHRAGVTGRGVGIALIDTGVTEVPGLDTGNVVHGPDLSFDSQDPELATKDAYGHGTHLASIMVGRDVAGTPDLYADPTRFAGIAPDATLLNVKVGASDGAVDVSQVIAGIDWVVRHRDDNGMNIRVINLSYGTDSQQDYTVDPLARAVEHAWSKGIVVVAAGGNDGSETLRLANPALDPHILAVGASDTQGTVDPKDDTVPAFASRGTNKRGVDVVAPGVSVEGLRVPNGYADERHPQARVGTRFAKASGTSQAAAVVSAQAALLLQRYPTATPDDVKAHLTTTAVTLPMTDAKHSGKGLAHIGTALTKSLSKGKWNGLPFSTGLGSLEAARGSAHVHDGVTELRGEQDIFGVAWDPVAYASGLEQGTLWDAGRWRGTTWTGDGWNARTWIGAEWTTGTWSARTWIGSEWSARTWIDGAWVARTWIDDGWVARTWIDDTWGARTWIARTWIGDSWSAGTWPSADLAHAGWS